jgi:hypothetical protein
LSLRDNHLTSPRGEEIADYHLVLRGRGNDLPKYMDLRPNRILWK